MDKTAWETHRMELLQYVSRMLGASSDSEDIVQTALLKAHQNGTQPENRRAWLYTIVRNEVVDHLRRKKVRQNAAVSVAEAKGPSELAETADSVERVLAAVAGLPESMREVIVLRFQQHLKFEEIAAVTGAPLGTVKVYAARGLKLLRERLKGIL
jgi:RNA polymerase sigma-70 factor (ECF subfamily)